MKKPESKMATLQRRPHGRAMISTLAAGSLLGLSGGVNAAVTNLTAAPPSPQVVGTQVTFTATAAGIDDNFVTFFDGANILCNLVPENPADTFTCATNALTVGAHVITAQACNAIMNGACSMTQGAPFTLPGGYDITAAPPAAATAIPAVAPAGLALMGMMLGGLAWNQNRRKKQ